jgi:hypothetical protein
MLVHEIITLVDLRTLLADISRLVQVVPGIPDSEAAAAATTGPPVVGWTRYELFEMLRARSRLRRREDPTRFIAEGRALVTDPQLVGLPIALVESARLGLVEAEWIAATRDGSESLRRALRDAETAIGRDHALADAQLVAAEACFAIATAQRSRELAKRGVEHVNKALDLTPQLAEAKQLRPRLEQLAR